MEMPPPPYTRNSNFIEPTLSRNIRVDPVVLTAWGDKLEQAALDLVPIKARLDALTYTLADDWCAPRGLENELHHLSDNLGLGIDDFDDSRAVYFIAKYLTETLRTLQEADADLAIWQRMTPAARDERWDAREREKAEAAERRKAEAVLRARHAEFYAAMKQLNVSPPRWLDNQIANWSLA